MKLFECVLVNVSLFLYLQKNNNRKKIIILKTKSYLFCFYTHYIKWSLLVQKSNVSV